MILQDKVAIVMGATTDIASALLFSSLASEPKVLVVGRSEACGAKVMQRIVEKGR